MRIELAVYEAMVAKNLGLARNRANRAVSRRDQVSSKLSHDVDIRGAVGELIFCKAANVWPDLDVIHDELGGAVPLADCVLPNGVRVDVKCVSQSWYDLLVSPYTLNRVETGVDVFAMVCLDVYDPDKPLFAGAVVGWASWQDVAAADKRSLQHSIVHSVPQGQLHPLSDLLAMTSQQVVAARQRKGGSLWSLCAV